MNAKVKRMRRGLSAFIASDNGQRFFNFAYSIGAAIVIWGALFKILHLPGGNMLLSIGMGTEVLMFILTAFDRPPRSYEWEKVYPQLDADDDAVVEPGQTMPVAPAAQPVVVAGAHAAATQPQSAVPVIPQDADMTTATEAYINGIGAMAEQLQRLQESTAALNAVNETLLASYRDITEHSGDISAASSGYATQMADLSRNIQGLNTIYEIQLKSVSSQLDAIDRVNRGIKDIRDMYEKSAEQSTRYCEETEKMARYMQQLNAIYEKMIMAMTANPAFGAATNNNTNYAEK